MSKKFGLNVVADALLYGIGESRAKKRSKKKQDEAVEQEKFLQRNIGHEKAVGKFGLEARRAIQAELEASKPQVASPAKQVSPKKPTVYKKTRSELEEIKKRKREQESTLY